MKFMKKIMMLASRLLSILYMVTTLLNPNAYRILQSVDCSVSQIISFCFPICCVPLGRSLKKKYGGIVHQKPPLISKNHERAYFDSANWALGKQGVEKPKGPLQALRPKLQPTQQQSRYRKSPCAPNEGEDRRL